MRLNKPMLLTAAFIMGVLIAIMSVIRLAGQQVLLPGGALANSDVVYLQDRQSFPRQVIDPLGRSIDLPKPPSAIVSGILAGDEMLSRLVDPQRIRSITWLADDPGISHVAGYYPQQILRNRGAIEETLATEPDLVIVAAYSDATHVDMLLNTGIPIIRFAHFHSYDDIRANVRTLARALGTEPRAEQWLGEMDKRITQVQQQVKGLAKPRVLYYSLSGSTSGPGSLMDETINLAGGRNVIADTGLKAHNRISPEMAIALQPEVILLSDWSSKKGPSAKALLLKNPAWKNVPAIRHQRIYSLTGAWLTSGSPYRVKGIEAVARLLHPQAFANDAHGLTPEAAQLSALSPLASPLKTRSL